MQIECPRCRRKMHKSIRWSKSRRCIKVIYKCCYCKSWYYVDYVNYLKEQNRW